jgi:hypothetical protein
MKLNGIPKFLLLLCIFILTNLNAHAQLIKQWVDTNDNSVQLDANRIRLDGQGNIYTLATKFTSPDWTMLTQKRNASGTLLWQNSFVQSNIYAKDMQVDASGNVYCFGEESGTGSDAWLVKYSSAGVQQWVYTLPPDFYVAPARIRIDNAGNVVLGYTTRDSISCYDPGTQQYLVNYMEGVEFIKLDGGGNMVMNFHYQPVTCADLMGITDFFKLSNTKPLFDIDAAGNIYFSYTTLRYVTNGEIRYHVMKVSAAGSIVWNNIYYSGIYNPDGFDVTQRNLKYDEVTQHVITTVEITADLSSTPYVPYLTAISNSGAFLWNRFDLNGSFGGGGRIETDGNGNIYWGYYSQVPNNTSFTIKKVSPTGNELWTTGAGGTVNADMEAFYDNSPVYRVDNAGNLYYYEWDALYFFKINKISPSGALAWQYTDSDPVFGANNGFAVDNSSNLYYYNREYLIKYNPCNLPAQSGTIAASATTVCPGDTVTFSVAQVPGITYNWTVPYGAIIDSGQGTNSISVLFDSNFLAPDTIKVVQQNNCGTSPSTSIIINSNNCSSGITLNLKLFIEGFYIGGGFMQAVLDPINYPSVCDSITVELHESTSPFQIIHSVSGTVSTSGMGNFVFPGSSIGNSYYIVVRNRNAIETWSKFPILFNGTAVTYDFTIP